MEPPCYTKAKRVRSPEPISDQVNQGCKLFINILRICTKKPVLQQAEETMPLGEGRDEDDLDEHEVGVFHDGWIKIRMVMRKLGSGEEEDDNEKEDGEGGDGVDDEDGEDGNADGDEDAKDGDADGV